jgi:Flp pilus assembly protein TadG
MGKVKKFSGQGLVEFALVLPILLILMIGALDYGFAFFTKVELENSAREGAFYMIYNRDDGINGVIDAVVQEGAGAGIEIDPANNDIRVYCKTGGTIVEKVAGESSCENGSTVIVTVRHQMPLAVDIFGNGPLELTSDARVLIP